MTPNEKGRLIDRFFERANLGVINLINNHHVSIKYRLQSRCGLGARTSAAGSACAAATASRCSSTGGSSAATAGSACAGQAAVVS